MAAGATVLLSCRLGVLGACISLATASAQAVDQRAAVLQGVVTDAGGNRIAGAEVALPALSLSGFTNDTGGFRIPGVRPGNQEITVRRLGFQSVSEAWLVPDSGTVERRYTLSAVPTLTAVEVSAPAMSDFEENRRLGLGKFLTRDDIRKKEQLQLPEILQAIGVPSFRLGSRAWAGSSRSVRAMSLGRVSNLKCSFLEGREVKDEDRDNPDKNPGCGCYAQVYLDEMPLYRGEQGGVVPDLSMIAPSSIEAVEYYKSAAQTPMKYSRLNSQCGVLVLHTRRYAPTKKDP